MKLFRLLEKLPSSAGGGEQLGGNLFQVDSQCRNKYSVGERGEDSHLPGNLRL